MNEREHMLLYWMYVVRLNPPQRCAWKKKKKKKKSSHIITGVHATNSKVLMSLPLIYLFCTTVHSALKRIERYCYVRARELSQYSGPAAFSALIWFSVVLN